MDDYLRATAVLSLSLIAVSSAWLFDPSKLWTAVVFLPLTFLLGFSSYISTQNFQKDSLAALPALMFVWISPPVAAAAVIAAVATPMVSLFTGGKHFRDFFSAVSMPLLVSGLALGLTAFVAFQMQPGLEGQALNFTAEQLGTQSAQLVEESGLTSNVRNQQIQIVRSSSEASVALTASYVKNASLNNRASARTSRALVRAQRKVPDRVVETVNNQSTSEDDLESRMQQSASRILEGRVQMLAIPVITVGVYSLNPLVGLLVALWAVLLKAILN